jgi:hypothetical protein
MHVEVVLAALVLVVAVLVAADFFRRTNDGPREYAEGQAPDAGREVFPASRAGSASSVPSFARPNWLVRTRLCLLAVVSAAAAALAAGGGPAPPSPFCPSFPPPPPPPPPSRPAAASVRRAPSSVLRLTHM